MPCGCSVTLRSLSHVLQLRHPAFGQLLCPVLPLRSFRSFVPLYYTTLVALLLPQGMASLSSHTKAATQRCTCLWQSQPYNTRRVPFRYTTSFPHFSSIQSTRCLCLCSPSQPAAPSGLSWLLYHYTEPPARNKSTRQTLA